MSKPLVRRRPRWALFAAIAALALIGWYNVRQSMSSVGWGRQMFLHEGKVEILQVEDAVTLIVRALDGPAQKYNGPFRVRLMGIVPREPVNDRADSASAALDRTNAFVQRCPDRSASLIFDRQRFDETETPLAYVFCGDAFLNAELLQARLVELKQPPGMPSKWMRELTQIAGDPDSWIRR